MNSLANHISVSFCVSYVFQPITRNGHSQKVRFEAQADKELLMRVTCRVLSKQHNPEQDRSPLECVRHGKLSQVGRAVVE